MAFTIANFSPVGAISRQGKAPAIFSYGTLDTHATVDGSGYFNAAVAYGGVYNMLEKGDIINVVVYTTAIGSGGSVSTYGTHVVKDKASGTVDVTNVTVGLMTDSD